MKIKFYFLGKTKRKKQQHFKMSPAENCSQGAIKVLYKSLLHIQTLHSFFFFFLSSLEISRGCFLVFIFISIYILMLNYECHYISSSTRNF